MSDYILDSSKWPSRPTGILIPGSAIKRCVSMETLKKLVDDSPNSQGVKIKIIRLGNAQYRRLLLPQNDQPLKENEFILTKDLILEKFTDYISLDINIIPSSSNKVYLIIERSSHKCHEGGPGGDGVKVRIPTE